MDEVEADPHQDEGNACRDRQRQRRKIEQPHGQDEIDPEGGNRSGGISCDAVLQSQRNTFSRRFNRLAKSRATLRLWFFHLFRSRSA